MDAATNNDTSLPLRRASSSTSSTSAASSSSFPSSSSPRKLSLRPPPLLLPSSASALSSPSSLSLASPVSPSSFSAARKQRNAKQLSLAVPSLSHSRLSGSQPHASTSTSQRPSLGLSLSAASSATPHHSPNDSSVDSDTFDLSETRSCPPTPRLILDTDTSDDAVLDASDRGELKSSLQGDMSMRRRTSLPRLKILSATKSLQAGECIVPPTPSFARPKTGIPALTVEALVARNKEAGAPLNGDSAEAEEDFPYQLGPKEILPGLYLGSEQNAKDPVILRNLGITQVICCAKEVACPWLAEEIQGDNNTSEAASNMNDAGNHNAESSPSQSTSYLAPPHSGMSNTASPTSHSSRAPSPSRPLFLRPAASTPNLKDKPRLTSMAVDSPSRERDGSDLAGHATPATSRTRNADRRVSPHHSGYLHRRFEANRKTGRPTLDYTKLPWGHDEDNIVHHFDEYAICELIDRARENGGRCLVHCQLGVSRSATLMIGYCMRQAFCKSDTAFLEDVKSMHDSYSFVRAKSRWVAPNIGLLAQLVQYERALAAETNPNEPLPYSNSAYYDSQLSLPGQHGSRTPDNLSPSSTNESEGDSRLTTPDTGAELLAPTTQPKRVLHQDISSESKDLDMRELMKNKELSPATASLRITRPTQPPSRLVLQKTAFGSAQRKNEHRKTFSADFSRFPLSFTLHRGPSKS